MSASVRAMASLSGQHLHAVQELCEDLNLPLHEVAPVYQAEVDRLSAAARIHNYVSLLAASHAHAFLRRRPDRDTR